MEACARKTRRRRVKEAAAKMYVLTGSPTGAGSSLYTPGPGTGPGIGRGPGPGPVVVAGPVAGSVVAGAGPMLC